LEIVDQTHRRHTDTLPPHDQHASQFLIDANAETYPEKHDNWDENARSHPLKKDIGQGLERRVRDEEDGQREVVLTVGHPQTLLQSLDFCISNVGPIQKTTTEWSARHNKVNVRGCIPDQIQQAKPWNQFKVQLPKELFLLRYPVPSASPSQDTLPTSKAGTSYNCLSFLLARTSIGIFRQFGLLTLH
jgi:hypothetical protein